MAAAGLSGPVQLLVTVFDLSGPVMLVVGPLWIVSTPVACALVVILLRRAGQAQAATGSVATPEGAV